MGPVRDKQQLINNEVTTTALYEDLHVHIGAFPSKFRTQVKTTPIRYTVGCTYL